MTEEKKVTSCPRCNSEECWHEYGDIYRCFHCHFEVVKVKKARESLPQVIKPFLKSVKELKGGEDE